MEPRVLIARIFLLAVVALSGNERGLYDAIALARWEQGLPMPAVDERLVVLARQRSKDMVERGYFSHTTPDGKTIFDMLDSLSVPSPYAGEILARTTGPTEGIMDAFLASPSHSHVIFNSHYTRIGVGDTVDTNGVRYITVIFVGP